MMNLWAARLTTFLLWALAAASAVFWVLQGVNAAADSEAGSAKQLISPVQQSPTNDKANSTTANVTAQVALALGAKNSVAPTAASALAASQARFQLIGVLAVGSKSGTALIAVDGKPAKPYRVGVAIEDGLEVTQVAARSASIGSNGVAAFTLELPIKN